jgi:hypothetical protein
MPKQPYKNLKSLSREGFTPIADHLKSVDFHRNRLWRLQDGKIRTLEAGNWYTAEEFEAKFGAVFNPVSFLSAPANADHTKYFMK